MIHYYILLMIEHKNYGHCTNDIAYNIEMLYKKVNYIFCCNLQFYTCCVIADIMIKCPLHISIINLKLSTL